MSRPDAPDLESRLGALALDAPTATATIVPAAELRSLVSAVPGVDVDTETLIDGGATSVAGDADALPSLVQLGLECGDEIGRGGMASVFVARQRALGREVAVKIARRDVGTTGLGELLREAWACGALEHPNLVPVHHLATDEQGRPALVMKRISGRTWRDVLVAEGASVRDALVAHVRTLVQVCHAVDFAHSRAILHRDIKPENVMIGDFGEVWLVDWGVAVALDGRYEGRILRADESEGIAGTPAYMAPEMVERSFGPLGVHTDVFLLGSTLHEILTGEPPWTGESIVSVLRRAMLAEPQSYAATVPAELARIARRAMSADPAARYPSVAAFRAALESYLEHRSAHELVAQARDRARELDALLSTSAPDPNDVQRLYTEARFGCEQALRLWSDGGEARALRAEIVARMASHEIEQGHLGSAERLVAELEEPPPSLVSALESLRDRVRVEQSELATLRRDLDLTVGARGRGTVVVVLGLVALVSGISLTMSARDGGADSLGLFALLAPQSMFVATLAVIVVWQRRRLLRTRVDRQFFGAFFALLLGLVAVRVVGVMRGLAFVELINQQLGLLAVGTAMMAVTIDRFMGWATLILGTGVVLLQFFPEAVFSIVGASQVLGCVVVGLGWLRRVRGRERAGSSG